MIAHETASNHDASRAVAATNATARSVQSLVRTLWRAYRKWRERRIAAARLMTLSDYHLKDIGLSRSQIGYAVGTGHLGLGEHGRWYR